MFELSSIDSMGVFPEPSYSSAVPCSSRKSHQSARRADAGHVSSPNGPWTDGPTDARSGLCHWRGPPRYARRMSHGVNQPFPRRNSRRSNGFFGEASGSGERRRVGLKERIGFIASMSLGHLEVLNATLLSPPPGDLRTSSSDVWAARVWGVVDLLAKAVCGGRRKNDCQRTSGKTSIFSQIFGSLSCRTLE